MKLLFSTVSLGRAFSELTSAARGYVPPQPSSLKPAVGLPQLVDAAVRFMIQFASDASDRDQNQLRVLRALKSELLAKLTTWFDEEGAIALRLWTHDMNCVVGELMRAAHQYAYPQLPSSEAVNKYVMETLPRNLTVAAVTFSIQLALEETKLDAAALRSLESALIRELEVPWDLELGEIPLSVDAQAGKTWGTQE